MLLELQCNWSWVRNRGRTALEKDWLVLGGEELKQYRGEGLPCCRCARSSWGTSTLPWKAGFYLVHSCWDSSDARQGNNAVYFSHIIPHWLFSLFWLHSLTVRFESHTKYSQMLLKSLRPEPWKYEDVTIRTEGIIDILN